MSTSVKVHNTRAIHALAGDEGQVSPNDVDISNVIDYKEVADILFNANNALSN
jgi:flagellar basal body L-ring protein FlgH